MNTNPLRSLVSLVFALALFGAGCSSVAPGHDPVVVNAERTTQLAVDTFDVFLKWEYDNRATLSTVPEIRKVADQIRADGESWLTTARAMTKAYKVNRTPENKANLQTAVAVLRTALEKARVYLERGAPPPLPQ